MPENGGKRGQKQPEGRSEGPWGQAGVTQDSWGTAPKLLFQGEVTSAPWPASALDDLRYSHRDSRFTIGSYDQDLLVEGLKKLGLGFEPSARSIGRFEDVLGERGECACHVRIIGDAELWNSEIGAPSPVVVEGGAGDCLEFRGLWVLSAFECSAEDA